MAMKQGSYQCLCDTGCCFLVLQSRFAGLDTPVDFPRSSIKLHQILLQTLPGPRIRSLQRTDTGVTLNRLVKTLA